MSRECWAAGEEAWGDHEPEPVLVSVGDWTLEVRGDELADLAFDGSAVLRSIRAVARDRDWGTVPTVVEALDVRDDGCDLRLRMQGLGADIAARVEVRVNDGCLRVGLSATSRTEFARNRLGLVVLHPPALAGTALDIGAPDGSHRRTAYPYRIAPHQPAKDIASLAWTHDGVAVTTRFDGDVFEMEDQRNWTDASYKTYSTPLALPFPVTLAAGTVVEQSIEVCAERVDAGARVTDASPQRDLRLTVTDRAVPPVTLGASTVPDAAWAAVALPHGVAGLLVELDVRTASWRAALDRARRVARDLPLDVRITADDPADVDAVVEAVAATGRATRLGVFSGTTHVTEPELWTALTASAARHLTDAGLVGGARSHFTELNREHERLPGDLPAIAFAMTPQMHATERAQLDESIAMQALAVRDAGRIADGRPLHVGPITLRSRFNAVATSAAAPSPETTLADGYGAEQVPDATDPRQASRALAAWAVASFAAICAGGAAGAGPVASVTWFETQGPRGIRDADGWFPVARAISAIAGLRGARLLVGGIDGRDGVWAVGGRMPGGGVHVLAANLGGTRSTGSVVVGDLRLAYDLEPYGFAELAG
ncbi:hypothetical protein [Agromyces mangrovi Wang et al. 2018]|uniref:hypothetical protein n=1 Tax=Agromyces mangrovi TaxID=1858653 RepID=UPI00257470EE|nr:hypothetical protein [Agromyces mangrovi]BDZ65314.1 hypothetical protein GCM10025877_22520 [Agromyces mangrovi]